MHFEIKSFFFEQDEVHLWTCFQPVVVYSSIKWVWIRELFASKGTKIKNTLIAQIPLCPFDIPLKHVQRWIKNMEKQGKTRATAQQTRQFAIQTLITSTFQNFYDFGLVLKNGHFFYWTQRKVEIIEVEKCSALEWKESWSRCNRTCSNPDKWDNCIWPFWSHLGGAFGSEWKLSSVVPSSFWNIKEL